MYGASAVVINAALYGILLFFSLKKNRQIGPIEILLALYALVATCGAFLYFLNPAKWNLSLFNYIYLFVAIVVFTRGITNDRSTILKKNPIANFSFYKKVSIIYVALSLFSCVYYIPQVYLILQNPEWAELYAESHEIIEGNIVTKMANAFFHLRYLGIVLFFSMLSQEQCPNCLKLFLGVGAFVPVLLVTILDASRGGLVILVASLIMAYCSFAPIIPTGIKKKIRVITMYSIPLLLLYFTTVSQSRFEDSMATGYSSSEEAFWDYLGQSMMFFNNGVMDCITKFGRGSYMFSIPNNSIQGTNFGSSFITFVGCLYLDYGPIFTLLIGIVISLLLHNMCKRRLGIPQLFLLLNYLMYLFYGAFVTASGYGYQWLEILVIYFGLEKLEKKRWM